jgi:hypothetical protein
MPGSPNQLADENDFDHYFNATQRLTTQLDAALFVLAERERELLELKGPCSTCPLHYAHSGPCDTTKGSGR